MTKIHVVLLHWNQADELVRLIQRLRPDQNNAINILVVDNASHPEEKQKLMACLDTTRIIENDRNLGYAGGINRALETILPSIDKNDMVALVNNDVELGASDLLQLASSLEQEPAAGMIGPVLIESKNGQEQKSWGGRDVSRFPQTRLSKPISANRSKTLQEVDYVPGTILVMRGSMLNKVGLLDEAFFFSGEIADLGWRARKAGYTCIIDTRIQLRHFSEDSGDLRSTLYRYYTLRNRFYFITKHKPRHAFPLKCFWSVLGLAMSLRLWCQGQYPEAKISLKALQDGWRGRFGPIHE